MRLMVSNGGGREAGEWGPESLYTQANISVI